MLEALHGKMAEYRFSRSRIAAISFRAWSVVDSMLEKQRFDTDFATFRIVVAIIHTRLVNVSKGSIATAFPNLGFVNSAKVLFTRAVYKLPESSWISEVVDTRSVLAWPEPEDIRALIETLGIAGDTDGLLDLVKWMQLHAEALQTAEQHRKTGTALGRINLILLRVFLESLWGEDPTTRQTHTLNQSGLSGIQQRLDEKLGWPTDEEVQALLSSWPGWLKGVREAIYAGFFQQKARQGRREGERCGSSSAC